MARKCPFCGYIVVTPRVVNPKTCAKCKRYFDEDHQPIYISNEFIPEMFKQQQVVEVAETQLQTGFYVTCENCGADVDRVFRFANKLLCRNCLLAEIDKS